MNRRLWCARLDLDRISCRGLEERSRALATCHDSDIKDRIYISLPRSLLVQQTGALHID